MRPRGGTLSSYEGISDCSICYTAFFCVYFGNNRPLTSRHDREEE
jgi:hypothetical protein